MVIITHLDPPVELAVSALTLRLNNDLIDEFKRCLSAGIKPKLVVKDGLMVSLPCGECASTGPEVAATDAGGAARVCHFGLTASFVGCHHSWLEPVLRSRAPILCM